MIDYGHGILLCTECGFSCCNDTPNQPTPCPKCGYNDLFTDEEITEEMIIDWSKVDCYCTECEWKGMVTDCETEMDSEGWEYPEYEVSICPKCGSHVDI